LTLPRRRERGRQTDAISSARHAPRDEDRSD
jgi:hypothetical protein